MNEYASAQSKLKIIPKGFGFCTVTLSVQRNSGVRQGTMVALFLPDVGRVRAQFVRSHSLWWFCWASCSCLSGPRKQPRGPAPKGYKYLALSQNLSSFLHILPRSTSVSSNHPDFLVLAMLLVHSFRNISLPCKPQVCQLLCFSSAALA